jgi:hypothetical protein
VTLIGYTMMCEQAGPKQLVRDVALAEQAGFDLAVISDHYFPSLQAQGHSPYAWSVLGAAAQATDHIPLMTYVTCPIRRYHPAVVAQKAATTRRPSASVSGIPVLDLLGNDGRSIGEIQQEIENDIRYANITIIEGTGGGHWQYGALVAQNRLGQARRDGADTVLARSTAHATR